MSGVRAYSFNTFLLFLFIGYWPVCLYLALFGSGYLLSLAIVERSHGAANGVTSDFFVQGGLALIAPVLTIVLSYLGCAKARDWKQRGWILYFSWLPIALIVGFVFLAAMGGTSQATVEGSAGTIAERNWLYLAVAIQLAMGAHLVIVPLVFLSVRFMKSQKLWE